MLRQILLITFLIFLISCKNDRHDTGKHIAADTTLKILTYGLPDREGIRAMNTVAKKYNFRYYAVAGCVVSKKLLDSINEENKKVYGILEYRFGKDWKLNFAAEVDTMENLQRQVEELVKKESYIVAKENELKKNGNGLDYLIDPTAKQRNFAVKAYSWGQWNGKAELLIYYKLTVDLKTKAVIKNSNVVERLYSRSEQVHSL